MSAASSGGCAGGRGVLQSDSASAAVEVVKPLRWESNGSRSTCSVSAKQLRAILRALGQPYSTKTTGAQLVELLNERICSPEALLEQPGTICQPSHACHEGGRALYHDLQAAARRRSARCARSDADTGIDPTIAAAALASWRAADADHKAAQGAVETHAKARPALLRRRKAAEVEVNRAARAAHRVVQPLRSARNSVACPFLRVLSLDEVRVALCLPERLGVVGLWRLRAVCNDLRRLAIAELASLPLIVALGKEQDATGDKEIPCSRALDLSTLTWKPSNSQVHWWIPGTRPSKRDRFVWDFCRRASGQIIAFAKPVPRDNSSGEYDPAKTYRCSSETHGKTWLLNCWSPGETEWKQVFKRTHTPWYAQAMTELADERLLAVGISGGEGSAVSEVKILAADLSEWTTTGRMNLPRHDVILSLCGKRVLAMGGFSANPTDFDPEHGGVLPPEPPELDWWEEPDSEWEELRQQYEQRMDDWTKNHAVSAVEAWDPTTGEWSVLPSTKNVGRCFGAGGAGCRSCSLPSGRIMVNPQYAFTDYENEYLTGDVFNPTTNNWVQDKQTVSTRHYFGAPTTLVSVVGGCIALGREGVAIYDEHSNCWYCAMAEERGNQRERAVWDPFASSIDFATTVVQ